jgi:hypothetical protein
VTGSPVRTSALTLRPKNDASLMISSALVERSPFSMAMYYAGAQDAHFEFSGIVAISGAV